MRVVVIGCGPAGLTAARAATDLGHDVKIMSNTWEPSVLYGCQYLHAPIPGYEDVPRTRVHYNLIGTPEQYRRKVYGGDWKGKVSPEDFIGEHDAWDIRETYRRMWEDMLTIATHRYNVSVRNIVSIRSGNISEIRSLNPDNIISTIPASFLCHRPASHEFICHGIYAKGDMKPDGLPLDHVLCVGTSQCSWYRISNVFGYRTVEWSALQNEHPPDAVRVLKPLYTNCNCHPDVIRVGRYGSWKKSFLVHQVYQEVAKALK